MKCIYYANAATNVFSFPTSGPMSSGGVLKIIASKIKGAIMPVQIKYEPNETCVLRISGILKRSEFGAEEKALARHIDTGSNPRLFVILENFEGWERGADWNDLDFYISHGRKISRIAIVAEPRWEALALAFAGAGVRRTPVKFFPPSKLEQARSWLAE
jgi:stage II sporulation SpoAA-like protein